MIKVGRGVVNDGALLTSLVWAHQCMFHVFDMYLRIISYNNGVKFIRVVICIYGINDW